MWPLAALTGDRINGFFYKEMYGRFAGPKKVAVITRLPVFLRWPKVVVPHFFLFIHSFLSFIHFFQTIGAAFGAKKVTVGNKCVTLGIWVNLFI